MELISAFCVALDGLCSYRFAPKTIRSPANDIGPQCMIMYCIAFHSSSEWATHERWGRGECYHSGSSLLLLMIRDRDRIGNGTARVFSSGFRVRFRFRFQPMGGCTHQKGGLERGQNPHKRGFHLYGCGWGSSPTAQDRSRGSRRFEGSSRTCRCACRCTRSLGALVVVVVVVEFVAGGVVVDPAAIGIIIVVGIVDVVVVAVAEDRCRISNGPAGEDEKCCGKDVHGKGPKNLFEDVGVHAKDTHDQSRNQDSDDGTDPSESLGFLFEAVGANRGFFLVNEIHSIRWIVFGTE